MPLLFACPLRPLRTWYRRLVQFATLTLAVCALLPRFSQAAPDQAKGATPWAMLLCNYADANVPANWQVSDFQRLFTPGQQGLSDYFHDVSYGAVDLSGSRVFGWFTLPYLENEAQRTITADATILAGSGILVSRNGHFHANDVGKEVWLGADGVLMPFTKIAATVPYDDSIALLDKAALKRADNVDVKIKKTRESLIEDCAHAAEAANVDLSGYYGIIAMRNDAFDSDSTGRVTLTLNGKTKTYGLVLLSDGGLGLNVSHISHEMLHGYGLQHSYGDPAIPCNNFKSGVYCDPWDIMSAMSVNAFKGAFGLSSGLNWVPWSGPGLDAGNLELLGWVPASRRWVWGGASGSVGLAPLGRAELPGMLSVLIPLQGYPAHYYSLELRSSDGWDRAFAAGSAAPWSTDALPGRVFLREVIIGGDGEPHTYLKRGFSAKCAKQYDFLPGSSFTDSVNKITIEVGYVAPDASSAAVTIRRQIPSDQEVCAQTIPYVGGSNDPGYPGYSGGTGSIDACTTCGPGGKTPPKHTQYQ